MRTKFLTLVATGAIGLGLGAGIGAAAAQLPGGSPGPEGGDVVDVGSMDEMHDAMRSAMPAELRDACDEMHASMPEAMRDAAPGTMQQRHAAHHG